MATANKSTPAPSKAVTGTAAKISGTKKNAVEAVVKPKPAEKAVTKKIAAKSTAEKVVAKKVTTRKLVAEDEKPVKKPVVRKAAPKKKAVQVSPEHRYHMIATAAYFLAEHRGFAGGYEMQDWISAEAEVDTKLKS